MSASISATDSIARTAAGATALAGGLILFSWFAHWPLPGGALGAAGLAIAGAAIVWASPRGEDLVTTLGFRSGARRPLIYWLVGVLTGALAGLAHRASLNLSAFDFTFQPFVIVACLIGAMEEVIYRGWLLGTLRRFGWPTAIGLSAVAHAAYKTALFAQPSVPAPIDYASLALLTAAGGLILGTLRAASRSLWPAIIAHAVFDLVVYRTVADAPWWVWG